MVIRWLVPLMLALGCGRLGFDSSLTDAATLSDDAAAVDAAAFDAGPRDGSPPRDARNDAFDSGRPDGAIGLCPPGLVSWYRFEEISGPVVDVCGRNHGSTSPTGTERVATGHIGRGISFDGTNGFVLIPASPTLDFISAGTIEMWIATRTDAVGTPLARGTGNNDDWILLSSSEFNIHASFHRMVEGSSLAVGTAAGALRADTYEHVAVVNDGVTLRLYLNARSVDMADGGQLGPLSSDLYFGRRDQGIFPLDGRIDEVKWWTIARSEGEVCADAEGVWTGSTCIL